MSEEEVRAAFNNQVQYCNANGAPITGRICEALINVLDDQMMGDLRLANDDRDATDSMLKESVQFADNIINSMFGMLIVISADRRIAKVNMATCNHLGYSEQQLLGRSVEMLFPTERPQAESESYGLEGILPLNPDERRQLLDTGTISEIEQWMVKKDGSKIPVLFSGSVLNHGGRKRSGLVCVAQDITKRKEFEDRLRIAKQDADSANRSKSEFLANMSHEIRTPMTAILGFAESLLDSELSDADREQSVQTIRRNGEYLLNIINDILDLSKIEAGMMTVERVDCHVERVVCEVQSLMSVRAAAKGLSLDVGYEGNIPQVVKTDPVRLRQILTNLVGNAIKFTETGNVRIITRFLHAESIRCLQFDVIDS